VLAWSPLAGGRLATPGDSRSGAVAAVLARIAEEQSVPFTAAALAWVMAHPSGAVPIVGSQTPARIREAARAVEVRFSRAQWYEVLTAARGAPLP